MMNVLTSNSPYTILSVRRSQAGVMHWSDQALGMLYFYI